MHVFYVNYRIVVSISLSLFEAHAGLFRLLMKGIIDPYVKSRGPILHVTSSELSLRLC